MDLSLNSIVHCRTAKKCLLKALLWKTGLIPQLEDVECLFHF